MALKSMDWTRTVVSTSSTGQAVLATYAIPTNCTGHIEAVVVGRNTVTGDGVTAKQALGIKRAAGSASVIGAGVVNFFTPIVDTLLIGSAVTMDVNSNAVRVLVTPAVSALIEWQIDLKVYLN